MNALQPKDEYQERYKEVLETGRLEPDLVGRSSSVIRNVGDRLGIIKTPNLIFVFSKFSFWSSSTNCAEIFIAATRPRPLRFSLVLFERKSESLEFAGHDCVDASSEQTVQAILDAVRRYIKLLPVHGTKTGHCIEVYKVWGLNLLFGAWLMYCSPRKHSRERTVKQPRTWKA